MISGAAFGASPGEVHFVIGPNLDKIADVTLWHDGQIFASLPDVSGVASGFNGVVYVVRGSDKAASTGAAFHFNPALEIRELPLPPSVIDSQPFDPFTYGAPGAPRGWYYDGQLQVWTETTEGADFFGKKGNREFFANKHLKNGWVTEDTQVICVYPTGGGGGAYLAGSRLGTDSPCVNVRVWEDAFHSVIYTFHVWIQGPKGVPYE